VACAAFVGCSDAPDGRAVSGDCPATDDHPTSLDCTGLYASAAGGVLAGDVLEFAPAEPLWSDGAGKRRFVRLPPGTTIDTTDMDEWVFPVGTKFWKEFSLNGVKMETRFLEKRADGSWLRTTYVWADDQRSATELAEGIEDLRGTGYDVPAQSECSTCHDGAADGVLGFEAIGLSGAAATGLTLQELIRRGLLSAPPAAPPVIPGGPLDVAALGWLHANCGNACHNGTAHALASWTGLRMRLRVDALGSVEGTDTYRTAVGVVSGFQPTPDANLNRISAGDPEHSVIFLRASSRNASGPAGWQMPPIATNVTDIVDLDVIQAWIGSL
jgi:hypothetical protein